MSRIIRICPQCGNNEIYAVSDRRHTCAIYLCCPACGRTAKPAGDKDYDEALRQAIVNWNLSAPLERSFFTCRQSNDSGRKNHVHRPRKKEGTKKSRIR